MYNSDKDSMQPAGPSLYYKKPCPNTPYYEDHIHYQPVYEEPVYNEPIYYDPAPMHPESPSYIDCPMMDPKIRECLKVCMKMNCGK